MKGLIAIAATVLSLTACTNGEPNTYPSPTPAISTTAPAPTTSPTPKAEATLSAAELSDLQKLRKEQPKVYTRCHGQGQEKSPKDVLPNLQILATINFTDSPANNHVVPDEFAPGLKVTTEPLGPSNVRVKWSGSRIATYARVVARSDGHRSYNYWAGMNVKETNFHVGNLDLMTGGRETWYILGYNPADRCGGRMTEGFKALGWAKMFSNSQLDGDNISTYN